jgi:hypothetical protein
LPSLIILNISNLEYSESGIGQGTAARQVLEGIVRQPQAEGTIQGAFVCYGAGDEFEPQAFASRFNKIFNLKLMINLLWLQYADVREISAALLRFIRDEFETLKLPN